MFPYDHRNCNLKTKRLKCVFSLCKLVFVYRDNIQRVCKSCYKACLAFPTEKEIKLKIELKCSHHEPY